jgi:hypothetical protein
MTKPLVYIAAPYTNPDPVENTHQVIWLASRLVDDGRVTPVVPHLSLLWHLVSPRPVEFWYAYDLELLAHCDAVLRRPGASTGADAEVDAADRAGIPVFATIEGLYRALDDCEIVA